MLNMLSGFGAMITTKPSLDTVAATKYQPVIVEMESSSCVD